MWKKNSLILLLISLCFFIWAKDEEIRIVFNKKMQNINIQSLMGSQKEEFELKNEKYPFVSINAMMNHMKLKKVETATIQSREGMSIMIKKKEFDQAGLILVQDKKQTYYRLVIKGDSFRNRWIKYINQIEFK